MQAKCTRTFKRTAKQTALVHIRAMADHMNKQEELCRRDVDAERRLRRRAQREFILHQHVLRSLFHDGDDQLMPPQPEQQRPLLLGEQQQQELDTADWEYFVDQCPEFGEYYRALGHTDEEIARAHECPLKEWEREQLLVNAHRLSAVPDGSSMRRRRTTMGSRRFDASSAAMTW